MQQLTRRVLRHKRLVALSWIVLTLVGMAAAGPASEALDQRFSVPGREGWDTSQEILSLYGNGGESLPLMAVVKLPEGTSAGAVKPELAKVEATAKQTIKGSRVTGYGSTGDKAFVSDDGRTAFVYVFTPRSDDPFAGNTEAARDLKAALDKTEVAGQPVRVTGYDALFDSSGSGDEPVPV